jgi:hypothetical protein
MFMMHDSLLNFHNVFFETPCIVYLQTSELQSLISDTILQLTSKSGTRCAITSLYSVKRTDFISIDHYSNVKYTKQ